MNGKFTVPELNNGVLIRENLLKELDDSSRSAFFISAGKGMGKTTLLCLYAKMKKNVLWYNADDSDNNPESFYNNFISAFKGDASYEESKMLLNPFWVINSLGNTDISVIIDGFENIKNPQITDFFKNLILFSSRYTKVIIASRENMPVDFTELLFRNKMQLIENGDIAFSAKEAEKAFGIISIEKYIESDGIPAVLAEGREDSAAKYYEDILKGLDENLRNFVCKSVFLTDIYPEICRAALGISNAEVLISQAGCINPISNTETGGMYYSAGFARYCADTYPETGLRVRRSAFDYCAKNGRVKEAVIYSALTGDTENISAVLRNNTEKFYDTLKCSDADILMDMINGEFDMYCRFVKTVCRLKNGLFEEAIESARYLCDNAERVDSRIDRVSFLMLRAKAEYSLFDRAKQYQTLTEAADMLKSYNADTEVKIVANRVRSLLFGGIRSKAIDICAENITNASVSGKYGYLNIFKLNMCLCRLVNNEPDKALAEYKTIDFECIKNYSEIGLVSSMTAIFFYMAGLEDTAFELVNNSHVFNSSPSDGKAFIDWIRRIILLKTLICKIAEGDSVDRACFYDALDINGRSGCTDIKSLKVIFLIFKRLVTASLEGDGESVKKGLLYLTEYHYGTEGFIAGECVSIVLALLIVLKKDKIAAEAVEHLSIEYMAYNRYPMEILPVLVYIKSKTGEDVSALAEKYVEAVTDAGRVATYNVGFINRPIIDYLDSTGKYGDIIDEIVRLTGTAGRIRICTFGAIDVKSGAVYGDTLKWRTAKTKELFAYFVHNGGGPVTKMDIVRDVFNIVNDDKKATEIFNTTMYNLRKLVKKVFSDNLFSLSRGKYSMDLSSAVVDIIEFRKAADRLAAEKSTSAAAKIVELYKGEYMRDVPAKWKGDTPQIYEDIFCNAATAYLNGLAADGKKDTAAESAMVIWNEKCRSDRIKGIITEMFNKNGIKAELK